MAGDYADDAWDPGDRWSWTPREGYPRPRRRPTNQVIFRRFAGQEENDTGLSTFRDTYDW